MLIGIDIGTSAVKIVLTDLQLLHVVATVDRPLTSQYPQPLWCEHDPDQWWAAVSDGLDELARTHPTAMAGVQGIGLSGQMHSLVLLDAADRPVRPAILWNDGRAAAEAAELMQTDLALRRAVGVQPMAGFTGPKLRWLRTHEPEAVARARSLLLTKDYVRLQLSGEKVTDVTDAAGTWLFDQAQRRWSPQALAACGVDPAWLPRVVESCEPCATVRDALAARWGLPRGVPIAGGAGDAAAGGVGIGVVGPGDGFVSLGTSAQILVADTAHRPDPERLVHAFCHALPQRWYRMAALLNGASPLAALASCTGGASVGELLAEVEAAYTGPSRLLALPYLFGERTPHNNPFARGAIVGLSGATTRADLMQAVCEGIAFSLADGLEALSAQTARPERLALIGGGARSAFLAQLIASVLDVPLVLYESADRGPAFGAARLARLAVTGEDPAGVVVAPAVRQVLAPDAALHAAYQPRLEAFRTLYRAMAPVWASVA